MLIFIPLMFVLFIVVPAILTRLATPQLGIKTTEGWWLLFIVIAGLNWWSWQAPKSPAPRPVVQVSAPLSRAP